MTLDLDLIIKNGKVFLDDRLVDATLLVQSGKIVGILESEATLNATLTGNSIVDVIDASGMYVLPGTIDPHVHIRAPGYEEREDFLSGTSAAANGGVTTIIEQPIANPPQYSLDILNKRIAAASASAIVDFAFYGAAGNEFPDKIQELADSGKIVGYKTFLQAAAPGRENEFMGLVMKDAGAQYEGMKLIQKTGLFCAVHAENNDMINEGIKKQIHMANIHGVAHAHSRPAITEYETVSKLLMIAKETKARIEFCHISTPEAMELIKQAKQNNMDVYLETCPHYLFMDESELDKHGPYAKCNPPLRDTARMQALWKYVNDGTVDFIGSDHAPYTYEEKANGWDNIFNCPAGIPCIEMRLPLMFDAVMRGMLTLNRMVELLSVNPAKIFGLYPKKGRIQVGSDADFVIMDPTKSVAISVEKMYTKSRKSAVMFEGMKLQGSVTKTIVRGTVVMDSGIVDLSQKSFGQLLIPNK